MNDSAHQIFVLTGAQRKRLRALGHHLAPLVYTGKEGISPTVLHAIEQALQAHELIKVKVGQNSPLTPSQAAFELTAGSGAALVQIIGGTILLYLPNPDLPREQQLLP